MTLQLRRLSRQILCFGGDELGGTDGVFGQGAGGGEVAELLRAVAQDAEGRGVGRLVGALRGLPRVAERLRRGLRGAPCPAARGGVAQGPQRFQGGGEGRRRGGGWSFCPAYSAAIRFAAVTIS